MEVFYYNASSSLFTRIEVLIEGHDRIRVLVPLIINKRGGNHAD
jgi:hypothetical protein